MPIASAFKGRKVLVTGHTGFKGSWLSLWLHHLGARVSGYSLAPPSDPSNFEASDVRGVLERHEVGDVRDMATFERAVRAADPDVIFHLAAQSLVRLGYEEPRDTFDVNVMGTVNVLEAVRRIGGARVCVMVTSDKCYENREQVWGYREGDPMGGYDPYSASKGCAELVVAAMRRSYFHPARLSEHGVKVASVRSGNVIGGGDWARDRIVTDIVRAVAEGRPVEVRAPDSVRPWQHVLDPLSGYLVLAARMLASDDPRWLEGWNFGPQVGNEIPVRRLVEMVIREYGDGHWVDASGGDHPHEARMLRLAIDKAVWDLGWRPRWGPRQAVSRLARWYHRFYRGDGRMREQCLEDIAAYEKTPVPSGDTGVGDTVEVTQLG